jgi:hypothetical protein
MTGSEEHETKVLDELDALVLDKVPDAMEYDAEPQV